MKANLKPFRNLIQADEQYLVPLYQRYYEWKKDEWGPLWKSVLDMVSVERGFIGFVIMTQVPKEQSINTTKKWYIIDGQQRLTTLSVLLLAIRDLLLDNDSDSLLAAQINTTFILNPYHDGAARVKLVLKNDVGSSRDNDAYIALVDRTNPIPGGVTDAYNYFRRELRKIPFNVETLSKLFEAVKELEFLSLDLEQLDDTPTIFRHLNGTGLKLDQGGLLRAYFYSRFSPGTQKECDSRWKDIEHFVGGGGEGRVSLTNFLMRFMTMTLGRTIRKESLYLDTMQHLVDHGSEEQVTSFLDKLRISAEHYQRVMQPSTEVDEGLKLHLRRLRRFKLEAEIPLLLGLYLSYSRQELGKDNFCFAINVLENIDLRTRMCKGSLSRTINFASLYQKIGPYLTSDNFKEEFLSIIPWGEYPDDDEFKIALLTRPFCQDSDDIVKYFLERLELNLGHKEVPDFEGDIQVEHIAPKELCNPWSSDITEGNQFKIGNLTLTGYNQKMARGSFPTKKKFYQDSHFVMNKDIAKYDEWTDIEITHRTDLLAKEAVIVWPNLKPDKIKIEVDNSSRLHHIVLFNEEIRLGSWKAAVEQTVRKAILRSPNLLPRLPHVLPELVSIDTIPQTGLTLLKEELGVKYYYDQRVHKNDASRSLKWCRLLVNLAGGSELDFQYVTKKALTKEDEDSYAPALELWYSMSND